MNTPAQTLPAKVPVAAGGKVAALVPRSLEEAFRVSQAIAASGLAPKGIDKPEQILVAIMAGAELGLAPFQSLQSIAVINGRPVLWGDGLVAIVRSQGFKVKEWLEGEGDGMISRCEVTRPDNEEVTGASFSVADAKKAGLWGKSGPWTQYPKRMLQMRARAFALRDGAADVLRGFQIREEVEDYQPIRDVTPQGTGMRARLEARTPVGGFDPEYVAAELDSALEGERLPAHDPQTGEIVEAVVEGATETQSATELGANSGAVELALDLAGPEVDLDDWAASFNRGLAQLRAVAEVEAAWKAAKTNGFVLKLKAKSPGLASALSDAVNERLSELRGAA